jgi:hypothetical protein
MAEAPRHVREVDAARAAGQAALPFRFGVVTLTECPQAFAACAIELADGRTRGGGAGADGAQVVRQEPGA